MEHPLFQEIKPWWLEILSKLKMTLNHLYIMEKAMAGEDVSRYKEYKMLVSVGWISSEGKVLAIGEGFCNALRVTPEPEGRKKIKVVSGNSELDSEWQKLWQLWPSTGNFTYQDVKYTSDRVLKSNKQVCMGLYMKARGEGVTEQAIYHGAAVELAMKMRESGRKRTNQLQYLSSLEVWLRQRKWESWHGVEIPKENTETTIYTEA